MGTDPKEIEATGLKGDQALKTYFKEDQTTVVYLLLHVDDFLISRDNLELLQNVKHEVRSKF